VIEQYRDELEIQIRGTANEQRIADDREAVASDLLNILHKSVSMMYSRDRINTDRRLLQYTHTIDCYKWSVFGMSDSDFNEVESDA
jgi:hypothetical protein